MARIYLAAPMRGVRLALNHVRELARLLEEMNHRVLTKHVTEEELDVDRGLTPREIFERDVQLLEEADVMIAEVSHPSLGVGFELAYFLLKGKPAAALVLE
ncbi:MAG: nucleoside 2-deoxyribosyltransferase, partial [Thermofilum sp.]